ncbi:MAG: DUF4830 domain-containing protein [Evtepia sp.]|uniref:DUF4830 domain-containing protein n=1 Tax=Evtepia sp. TaxID=2773933 RepID=UPI002A753C73|nr:DUF4830 domain-containing protein [Evtepia sp.]MDY3015069.1 DUF4830 domain-containing protein [Evtepia sp.]
MLIVAKKFRPARFLAGLVLLALGIGFTGAGLDLAKEIRLAQTAMTIVKVDPTNRKTNEDRVAYLEQYGWIVEQAPVSIEDIRLPESFDRSYEPYLSLQEAQGFSLQTYAGKTIKRYTYSVQNYPGLKEGIWACLLLDQNTVIGGEIHCSQGDGFTQGLEYPIKK